MTAISPVKPGPSRPDTAWPDAGKRVLPEPDCIAVTGGKRLKGIAIAGGSVHAAHVLLAAAAASPRTVTLVGLPESVHIERMILLVEATGCAIERGAPGEVTVKPGTPSTDLRPRSPLPLFDGVDCIPPVLHVISGFLRHHECAVVPWPQAMARAEVDDLLAVYRQFGDTVETDAAGIAIVPTETADATVEIAVPTRAVAPTVAAVLRACVSGSRIIVGSPSRHPEVHALVTALRLLGWRGLFTEDRLDLEPGTTARPTLTWTVPGDELEAAACVCALAATRSTGTVGGVSPKHLSVLTMLLTQAGARTQVVGGQVRVKPWASARAARKAMTVPTGDEPRDLPTDQLPLLLATVPELRGRQQFRDRSAADRIAESIRRLTVFEESTTPGEAAKSVGGDPSNRPTVPVPLEVHDAVAALALVIAALTSERTSVIGGVDQLHRSHPGFLANLRRLGAGITDVAR